MMLHDITECRWSPRNTDETWKYDVISDTGYKTRLIYEVGKTSSSPELRFAVRNEVSEL